MHFLEYLYYLGLSAKKKYALRTQKRLPFKVISIGNITVGGTGKTPAVISVAREALKRGFSPVILTRGYKGKAKGPCFVTRGEGPLLSVLDAGDEPLLMAEKLKGVTIVKGSDRHESGVFFLREYSSRGLPKDQTLFILDDGFQHWKLFRDKDIVLIDMSRPFGNRRLLPLGTLREPLQSISRADIIVLKKSPTAAVSGHLPLRDFLDNPDTETRSVINTLRLHNEESPVFCAEHIPAFCELPKGVRQPVSWLSGKKIFGFCAIGNPLSFKTTLESAGAELTGFKEYRDHYSYSNSDLRYISNKAIKTGAEWIVTTEKDIIKLRNLDLPDNILIIVVDFLFEEDFFQELFRF